MQQREAVKAEQERQARAAAEAEEKRKAEQAAIKAMEQARQGTKANLFTIQRDMVAWSAPHDESFFKLSFFECEQKCAQGPTCKVFTHNKYNGFCFLYLQDAALKPNPIYDFGVRN